MFFMTESRTGEYEHSFRELLEECERVSWSASGKSLYEIQKFKDWILKIACRVKPFLTKKILWTKIGTFWTKIWKVFT